MCRTLRSRSNVWQGPPGALVPRRGCVAGMNRSRAGSPRSKGDPPVLPEIGVGSIFGSGQLRKPAPTPISGRDRRGRIGESPPFEQAGAWFPGSAPDGGAFVPGAAAGTIARPGSGWGNFPPRDFTRPARAARRSIGSRRNGWRLDPDPHLQPRLVRARAPSPMPGDRELAGARAPGPLGPHRLRLAPHRQLRVPGPGRLRARPRGSPSSRTGSTPRSPSTSPSTRCSRFASPSSGTPRKRSGPTCSSWTRSRSGSGGR